MLGPTTPRHVDYKYGLLNLDICDGTVLFPKAVSMGTRPSALGMSDPVMEFLEFHEKGKIFWVKGGRF